MTPGETNFDGTTTAGRGQSPLLVSVRQKAVSVVVATMEAVLLIVVCLSPWAYGAIHPGFEFLLDVGIAVLLMLWGLRMLLEGQFRWKKSPVALCLAGLFLLGVWQRTPLPRPVLALLSPGTARCYDQMLPAQPEILPDGTSVANEGPRPGSTLSLYPGATRREAGRLLAVLLVFAVVYNNLTSKGTLVRLSIVALVNGFLLSLFALAQFLGAQPNTLYWQYSTRGGVFGPFTNYNHFAEYVNLCIGLGLGLLLSRERGGSSSDRGDSLARFLQNPLALWICAALGFMVCASIFSRSRGGLLALVGAAVVCGVIGRLRLGRSFRLGFLLLVAAVVIALSTWFGTDQIAQRIGTLRSGEAFENRVPLWLRSLPIAADFPLWGTGYGTFGYVEPMYRGNSQETFQFRHAHNDYLELLVEGGVLAPVLAVLAIALVYRLGYRGVDRGRGRTEAALTLGALFAFTTVVLHGFGEFGMHIPAITLLTTVICAHLCAQGQSSARQADSTDNAPTADTDTDEYHFRLGGIAPVFGALTAVGLGLALCSAGWKAHRVDRLEEAAFQTGSAEPRARIAYYTQAVALAPENAQLHYELGSAHARLTELATTGVLPDPQSVPQQTMLALREFIRARDACPLLALAHQRIAAFAPLWKRGDTKRGDTPEDYLRRAKLLAPGLLVPSQAELWYRCGLFEFTHGRSKDAQESWRHCLELSEDYLPKILNHASGLAADQLVEDVLPDRPDLLLAAALRLYPDADAVEQRRPFLEKALRLLDRRTEKPDARQLHVKALAYRGLDQPDKAIQSYRELLDSGPSQAEWRFEFARYLYDLHKLEAARRELTILVAQNPNHWPARELLRLILREQLQKKPDPQRAAHEKR